MTNTDDALLLDNHCIEPKFPS